jgi:hypothetical protein
MKNVSVVLTILNPPPGRFKPLSANRFLISRR